MVISKKLNLDSIFIFLFLVIFPFGQIIRFGIIQPLDVVVGLSAIYSVVYKLPKPDKFKYLEAILWIFYFSWFISIFIFKQIEVLYGFLYLVRLSAYFYFLIYVLHFIKKYNNSGSLLTNCLLVVSIVSAIFGWVQYIKFPALRSLMVLGWDEHLYRLAGTFLDPTYLGLIIVFGLCTSIIRMMEVRKKWMNVFIGIFLLISLAYTYSRASYLAFFAGLLVILYFYRKLKYFILSIAGFFIIMLLLPTSKNQILSFTREFTAQARIENYIQTLLIFKNSPVIGVGYDNLCLAKAQLIGRFNPSSHSCSGSDSSILFILATTGIIGLIIFINSIYKILSHTKNDESSITLKALFAALLIHSFFSNSAFYPWIMGYLIIFLAINLRSEVEG